MLRLFLTLSISLSIGCTALFTKPTTTPPPISVGELTEEMTAQVRSEFRRQVEENERVQRIADRILLSSADLCSQTKKEYGLYWIDAAVLSQLSAINQSILLDYFGLDHQDFNEQNPFPFVSAIRNGSGAEDSGLQKRDRIVRFNGQLLDPRYEGSETGKNRFGYTVRKGRWIGKLSSAISSSLEEEKPSVLVEVLRRVPDLSGDLSSEHKPAYKDTILELSMSPKEVCDCQVAILTSGSKNAYTDGENIWITTGFLSSLSDEELAFIISHELAHIVEGHIDKKEGNQFVGSLLGATLDAFAEGLGTPTYRENEYRFAKLGQQMFSQEFEAEADYLGLYILARAGYSTEKVADFWRKLAREMPMESNSLVGTHPPTAYRYLMLSKTHLEIEKKKASGSPLLPERLITVDEPKHKRIKKPYGPRSYTSE